MSGRASVYVEALSAGGAMISIPRGDSGLDMHRLRLVNGGFLAGFDDLGGAGSQRER